MTRMRDPGKNLEREATLLLGRSSEEAGRVSLSLSSLRVSYHGWGGEVRRRECHRTSSSLSG